MGAESQPAPDGIVLDNLVMPYKCFGNSKYSQHRELFYRFDDDEPQERTATVSPSGHVLRIWSEVEREAFANAKRLRIQTKPLVVFDFDLRGIETIAARLKC